MTGGAPITKQKSPPLRRAAVNMTTAMPMALLGGASKNLLSASQVLSTISLDLSSAEIAGHLLLIWLNSLFKFELYYLKEWFFLVVYYEQ